MKILLFLLIPVMVFCQSIDSVDVSMECEENKLSFGVVYIPHFTGEYYHYLYDPFYGTTTFYIFGSFESVFESQFSYAINPKIRLIFDVGYSSSYIKKRYERQTDYDSYGYEETDDMQVFVLNLGIKYYFHEILDEKVTAYIQGSIGKQFAFIKNKYRNLYPDPYYPYSFTDKENEYLEDINSPFLLTVGFGTEYFFNKSLSLNASLRLVYSSFSGAFESREDYQSRFEYIEEKTEFTEIIKRVGLGLNFYF